MVTVKKYFTTWLWPLLDISTGNKTVKVPHLLCPKDQYDNNDQVKRRFSFWIFHNCLSHRVVLAPALHVRLSQHRLLECEGNLFTD